MKSNLLKIYTTIAIIVYILFIGNHYVQNFPALKFIYDMGKTASQRDFTFKSVYFVNLSSTDNFFPEEGIQTKDGDRVLFAKEKVRAAIITDNKKDHAHSRSSLIPLIATFILNMFQAFILVFIPILAYLTLSKMSKGLIFETSIVKKLRIIALSFLALAFLEKISSTIDYFQQKELLNFEEYTIKADPININLILVTFVVMIVAEVINKGAKLKEEQDLTI